MKIEFKEVKFMITEHRTMPKEIVNRTKTKYKPPDKAILVSHLARLELDLHGIFDPALIKRAIMLLTGKEDNKSDQ